MGLFTNYFYNGTIRLYQVALEAALYDLKVMIGDKLTVVPLYSSSGERVTYGVEDEPLTENVYPRATIKFLDMEPDEDRQLNTNIPKFCSGQGTVAYNPIPKLLTYQYTAITKKRDHALQIIEQIMYVFSPYRVFRLKEIPGHETKVDVKIKVQFRPIEDNYTDSEVPVSYTVDLLFTIAGNIYGQTESGGVINEIIIETNETGDMDQDPLTVWFTITPEV